MLQAPKPEFTREIVPQGTHIARCIRLIHIGTIPETYMGEARMINKIRLTFEFPEELRVWKEGEDAKPMVHDQEYTLSMGGKSNLRKVVEGMIGTTLLDDEAFAFNHEDLVGMACLLSIKHKTSAKGNTRAEIASASPLMKGQVAKEAFNTTTILTYEKWDEEKFNKLPKFLQDKIRSSSQYKVLKGIDEIVEVNSDDVPF
jgi:hypothetical protein